MPPARTPPHVLTLVIATAVSVLALNMFLPSLAHMAEDFGVSYATMTWAVSFYFAATAVVQLVLAPLSDLVGRRPVMLAGFAIFAAGSVIAATADSYGWFLAGRVLQCAVATGSALSAAIVRDTHAPDAAAARLGTIGAAMALAPMVGPLVGGLLDAAAGWRANFWAYSLLGLAALVLFWIDLGETRPQGGGGFARAFRGYRELLHARRFWANAACVAFSAGVFFLFLTAAPIVAVEHFGLSTASIGVALAVTPLGYVIGNLVTRKAAGRVELALLPVLGRLLTLAGLGAGLIAALAGASAPVFFGLMVTIGIGNGLTIPAAMAGSMSVRPDLAGSASGLVGASTVAVGAVATAIAGPAIGTFPGPVALVLILSVCAAIALAAALAARVLARNSTPDIPDITDI